jgi:hypothetical protein
MPNLGQVGRNEGITGAVDLPGASAKFTLIVKRWQPRLTGSTRPRRGRGGGVFATVRWLFSSGNIVLSGQWHAANAPLPSQWKGQTGTITVQPEAGKTITYPILVTEHGFEYVAGKDGKPYITLAAQVTGVPTYSGWTSTPTATDPTKSNQEQWGEGTVKTYDPKGLLTVATRSTDVWGDFADSDGGEMQLLAQIIAAAQPPVIFNGQTLKLRQAQFMRDAVDGGTVIETWGLTDSADDVLLPLNTKRDDPSKLASEAHSAAINSAAPNPGQAHTVLVATSSKRLNDGNTLNEAEYGPRTGTQEVEQEGTQARIDKSGLESTGQDTKQFDTASGAPADAASPDASLKAVATTVQELTADQSKKVTYFDVASSDEKLIFQRATVSTDASSLKSVTIRGAVFTTGDEPAAPTVAGLVLRDKEVITLTSPDTSNQSVVFWSFAETTYADDVVFEHQRVEGDPQGIRSTEIKAQVYTGAPAAFDVPEGLKIIGDTDIPLTDSDASGQRLYIARYGKLDSLDEIRLPKQKTTVDGNSIADDAIRTKAYASNTTPPAVPDDPPTNNVKIIAFTDSIITPAIGDAAGLYLRTWLYGPKDSRDEEVLKNYETVTDPSGLESTAIRACLDGESISDPAGYVLRQTKTLPLTLSLGVNRTLTVKVYGLRSTQDDVEMEETRTRIDTAGLNSEGQDAAVYTTTDGEPGDAAAPAGLKVVGKLTKELNRTKSEKVTYFDVNSSAEKVLFGRSKVNTDPAGLQSTTIKGAIFTTGSEPAAPTVAGLVLRSKEVLTLSSPDTTNQSVVFWEFAQTTIADDEIFRRQRDSIDIKDIKTERTTAAIIGTGASAPSSGSTFGTVKIVDYADIPLTDSIASNKSLRVIRYAKLNSFDEQEVPRNKTHVDLDGSTVVSIRDEALKGKVWLSNATAPTDPDDAPSNNVKKLGYDDLVLAPAVGSAPAIYLRVWTYGSRSSADELILPNYKTTTDASGIRSTAVRAALDGDVITDPPGFVLRETIESPISIGLATDRTLTVQVYGLVSVKTEMENEATVAKADPFGVYTRKVATIVPKTGTAASMATAAMTANQSDSAFTGVEVQILNDNWARQIIETSGEDLREIPMGCSVVRTSFRGIPFGAVGLDTFPAAAYGNTAAAVKVLVLGRSAGGLGFLNIQPDELDVAYSRFLFRRTFITSTPETYFHLDLVKKVCSGTFLGRPAHQVRYVGPKSLFTRSVSGAHAATIDYEFETSDAMFVVDGSILVGRFDNNASAPFTASGYYAATLFDSTALLKWPAAADFSVFTS